MKRLIPLLSLTVVLWLGFLSTTYASEQVANRLIMVRIAQSFPETMLQLQTVIGEYGYTVSRVQRVDIGLTTAGFDTDKYRIVFFAKPQEFREITAKYPQLLAYLPLQFTIFAEDSDTLITMMDPIVLTEIEQDQTFVNLVMRWRNDVWAMLDEIRSLQ